MSLSLMHLLTRIFLIVNCRFQKNLQEPVMLHYRELYRRAKKKKGAARNGHPLIWQVRAEFKMGVFSEFRLDTENAIKYL